jgi:nucleoside-diphosphate-sugar epimerase
MDNKIRILLTGSNGFIGGYFLKEYKNIFEFKKFSFLHNNIENLNLKNINTIVHCGALVHQINNSPTYDEYLEVNVNQAMVLAEKAKQSNVNHFIFLSTVKVYGEKIKTVLNENSKTNPQNYYSKSKLKAEEMLKSIESPEFKITIIRTPLVYGPGVKANFLMLIKLIKFFPIIPLGGINNKRSMIFVGNLCDMLFQIINKKAKGLFIAKDDLSLSISELVKLSAKAMQKKVYLFRFPLLVFLIKIFYSSIYNKLFLSYEFDNTSTMKNLNIKKNKFTNQLALEKTLEDYK